MKKRKYHIVCIKQFDNAVPMYDEKEVGRFTIHFGNKYYEGSVYEDGVYAKKMYNSIKEMEGDIEYKEIEIN